MDPWFHIFGLGIDPTIMLFGFGIGLLVGMTGMGGASLMTPLLILIFGIQPVTAIGTDIFYAAVTKTVGGYKHLKLGTVHKGLAFWLAVGSVPSAIAGVWVIELLQRRYGDDLDTLVLGMLGGTLVVVGVATLLRSLFLAGVIQERSAMHLYRRHIIAAVITGMTTGFVIGLTSAGSGTLIAIALIAIFRLTPQRVVGTDVFHAAVLLWAAGIAHWIGGNIDFLLAGTILVGSIPGVHHRHRPVGQGAAELPALRARRRSDGLRHDPDREELRARDRAPGDRRRQRHGRAAVRRPGVLAQPRPRTAARTPAGRRRLAAHRQPRRSRFPGHVRLRQRGDRPRRLRPRRPGRASRRLREDDPTIEQIVFASVGSIFRNYNLILDQVKDRDDVEALVLIHQDAEIQDPQFIDEGAGGARRPRRRDRRLRGGGRRAQHRLVGGLDHLGLVHPPLRRARRRRDPGVLVDDRVAAARTRGSARSTRSTAS